MIRKVWSSLFALGLVVTLSASAFAGEGKFVVSAASKVQGNLLVPGDYTASWTDEGEVRLIGANGRMIKVQGKVVERAEKAARTSMLKTNEDQVLELRFSGKKTVLVFEDSKVAQKQ
jgi:hypothetical protein